MSAHTITGAGTQNTVVFTTTNDATYAAALTVFGHAVSGSLPQTIYESASGTVGGNFIADNTTAATITGGYGSSVVGALAGKNATFLSGSAVAGPTVTSSSATLYAGDGTNSTIENNNPYGTVTAFFGTGAGTGIGQGEYNTFSSDAEPRTRSRSTLWRQASLQAFSRTSC